MPHFKTVIILALLGVNFAARAVDDGSSAPADRIPRIKVIRQGLTPDQMAAKKAADEKAKQDSEAEQGKIGEAIGSMMSGGGVNSGNPNAAAGTLSGIHSSNNQVRNNGSVDAVRGDCKGNPMPNDALINHFKFCLKDRTGSQTPKQTSMVVDTDNRVGYLVDESGTAIKCFSVNIGSAGTGIGTTQNAPTGQGDDKTELGMFFTGFQDGEKYKTLAKDPERQGISMGFGSKVIHSSHGNGTTAGCIGIEMGQWQDVFQRLSIHKAPVFVYSSDLHGCGLSHGSGMSTTPDGPGSHQ